MISPVLAAELPIVDAPLPSASDLPAPLTIALVGNPNAGKTSLFNRLTGLRSKTANFAGTTVEYRRAPLDIGNERHTVIDLPGLYSLDPVTEDERVACRVLAEGAPGGSPPDILVLVLDATNLERGLLLAGQALELGRPTVAAINLVDAAKVRGVEFHVDELHERLGCPVVLVSARTGVGIAELRDAIAIAVEHRSPPAIHKELAACGACRGCHFSARFEWAAGVHDAAVRGDASTPSRASQQIDHWLTHPVLGVAAFLGVMALVFVLVFWIAQYPMTWIEEGVAAAGDVVGRVLPDGDFRSLVIDGLIAGVGGVIVFLPQICLLFFVLALLEDTGYMARAALVMDKLMHRVGLPGKAFVPMLSAHACAIPAIMATRIIDDRRDRLATIMVLPLLTCSARVPVYALVMAMLFPDEPLMASLLFTAAYALGIVAALAMAWVFKHSLLKGPTRPLVIELPNYRQPSLKNALLMTLDRARAFIATAGTTILAISLVLWALATYPKAELGDLPALQRQAIQAAEAAGDDDRADQLLAQAELEYSAAGRLGKAIEPVFAPLGFEWRTTVGVLTSFAARETVVSTLSILYGMGDDGGETRLTQTLGRARRADGSPVFTTAVSLSLLVFFVLAMQCLPTQAVTRRETGTWRWPALQLGYMTVLAYVAALVTFQGARALGL